jgi:isopropylmalate/homocitrate/citramalate synthase
LTPLANLVQKITGVDVPSNKPVVGRQLYQIESGIIASWYKNCPPSTFFRMYPPTPFRTEHGDGSKWL